MEDKLNSEADDFKKIIRDKVADEPSPSSTDSLIWQNILAEISHEKQPTRRLHTWYWYASAAVLLLGVGLSILFFQQNGTPTQGQLASKPLEDTSVNAQSTSSARVSDSTTAKKPMQQSSKTLDEAPKTVFKNLASAEDIAEHTLGDQSRVTLNEHSAIQVLSDFKDKRVLQMEGEAYFEVTPNKAVPFVVYFGACELEVLGTKFNVRNYKNNAYAEVTVTEGLVKVIQNKGKAMFVKAGEQLKLAKHQEPIHTQVEAINFISWKTHTLDFKKSRLEDVAEILSRRHHQAIQVDKPIKDCIFSGDLSELSLNEALEVIKTASSLKVDRKERLIYISGYGCN